MYFAIAKAISIAQPHVMSGHVIPHIDLIPACDVTLSQPLCHVVMLREALLCTRAHRCSQTSPRGQHTHTQTYSTLTHTVAWQGGILID